MGEFTAKDVVDMVKAVLITIVLAMTFYAILRVGGESLPSREMTVIDCYPTENYWTVVVEDTDGNQWSYYADHYTENGIINVQMDGDEIVDVR